MYDQYNPILDESYPKNNLPKMDDQYNPVLYGYYAKYPSKMDDQYYPILDESYFQNNPPRTDDHIHPTLGDYCSFCSLYKKSVSFSSKYHILH